MENVTKHGLQVNGEVWNHVMWKCSLLLHEDMKSKREKQASNQPSNHSFSKENEQNIKLNYIV